MDKKKIVIGIPHTGTLYTDIAMNLMNLAATENKYAINIQMLKSSILYISREYLVSAALQAKADYLMFLDSDQTISSQGIEKLASYLDNGENIATTLIFRKDPPFHPCVFSHQELLPTNQISLQFYDIANQDLTKHFYVASSGFGCIIMKLDIFKKMPQPWFLPAPYSGEDITFMYKAAQMGYKTLCDPTIEVGHYGIKNYTRQDYLQIIEEENRLLNGAVTPEVYK